MSMAFGASLVRVMATAVGMTSASGWAAEQTSAYPSKPIHIVAPSGPGSSADTLARAVATPLAERFGKPVVVDTRPGAGSILGTALVAKAPADGYTLLIATPAIAINTAIGRTLSYDGLRDFAPITLGISQPNVLALHPSVPVKSVKELIALARARPGEIPYASAGVGAISHLTIELFLLMTKTRMLHVPYKGSTAGLIDLIGGRVALMGTSAVSTFPHLRSGRLRPLAVTTAERTPVLPEVPTVSESGVPGYEAVGWFGLMAPSGTPKEIVSLLHKEIVAVLNRSEIRERFKRDGADVVAGTPEQFAAYVQAEVTKWSTVVKAAKIKAE